VEPAGHPLDAEGPASHLRRGLRATVPAQAAGRESAQTDQGEAAAPQGPRSPHEIGERRLERGVAKTRTCVPGRPAWRRRDDIFRARTTASELRGVLGQ